MSYDSQEELLNTLPLNLVKILNQFVEKNDFFPPSVQPVGYNHSNDFFDVKTAVFCGPYGSDGGWLLIE